MAKSPKNQMTDVGKPARGRPRSEKTRAAILKATAELTRENGVPGVTIEAVAARAGVGKPTIYRYWANAHELVMAALMEAAPTGGNAPSGDDPLEALRAVLHRIAETFASTTGRYVAMMLAAANEDSEVSKAFRSHFIRTRRGEAAFELKRAEDEGLLREGADVQLALDMMFGAVFYRLLMEQKPLDKTAMDRLLDACLHGLLRA
ncbi:TetR/AcrR family transcriptional regulator [Kordiimonas sp.]|uniref:TetR/AcrR family transcriptional regulator n=1 Tax=Kordiimonas sp. TaxID=1970157 RepID=UPI003A9130B5